MRIDVKTAAQKFPIGTPVRFYPIAGEEKFEETVVRSEPWLVCGHVSLKVKGRAGGVSAEPQHLQVIEQGS